MVKSLKNIKYSNSNHNFLSFGQNSNDNIEGEYAKYSINKDISEEELIYRYINVRNSNTYNFF